MNQSTKKTVLNIAHRGASGDFPENTLLAFKQAVAAGADWIELDIQHTADGVVVVIHDDTVDRTTDGSGEVSELSYQQIAKLDAGSWLDPKFAGQKIPTLAEALEFLSDHPYLKFLVEYKDAWTLAEVEQTILMYEKYQVTNQVILQSFYPQTVSAIVAAGPNYPNGLLVGPADYRPYDVAEFAQAIKVQAINPYFEIFRTEPDFLPEVQAKLTKQVKHYAWTADEPEDWQMLLDNNITGIITNKPAKLSAWLAK